MRKGFLPFTCLLFIHPAPLWAQYYTVAPPAYGYVYGQPAGPQGYFVPARQYYSPGYYGGPAAVPPGPVPYRYPTPGYPPYPYPRIPVGRAPGSVQYGLPPAGLAPGVLATPVSTGPAALPGSEAVASAPPATATRPVSQLEPPVLVAPPPSQGEPPVGDTPPAVPPLDATPSLPGLDPFAPQQPTEAGPSCAGGAEGCPCAAPAPPPGIKDCFWIRAEYLMWFVRNSPTPFPLLTTGNPAQSALPGALGQPGTQNLFGGGSGVDFGLFSGGRLTSGFWLNPQRSLGLEASGFALEQKARHFAAASDPAGNPPLYAPAFNAATGSENRLVVADPTAGFAGSAAFSSTLRLWGVDGDAIINLCGCGHYRWDALVGARYLDLTEKLAFYNTTQDLVFLTTTTLADSFQTRNQFYGGQVGSRVGLAYDRLSLILQAKVALGNTHEVINVAGSGFQGGPAAALPVGQFTGGFLAQPTNIGHHTRDQFAVVPEVQARVAYALSPHWRISGGYTFLYWSDTVRPANQIDRSLNLSQSPAFGPGTLTGAARPQPETHSSSFWAHGASVGLEYRY